MLGTVQFGLNYGIANLLGKPPYETSRDIVRCAFEGAVNCMDTADAYGDSEEVVGQILDRKIRMTQHTQAKEEQRLQRVRIL